MKDKRPFWKIRGPALLLTLVFGAIIIENFALIVFGGVLQNFLIGQLNAATYGRLGAVIISSSSCIFQG